MEHGAMPDETKALPKMMLGFVVRRCAAAVGHDPTPEEFAAWANNQRDGHRTFRLFGRPISVGEARLILRHKGRPVTARSATRQEQAASDVSLPNVTSFASAVARLKRRTGTRKK
jgi:hypothetical protein